jgi:sulfotransferase family protein
MESSAATPINKPIFVVGSPRSGTSILSWCLGQHPNIVVIPESDWMGDFAVDLAIRYQIGTARGNRSVLSAMGIEREEFFAHFGQSINDLLLNHREEFERKRRAFALAKRAGYARVVPNALPEASVMVQPGVSRKARWVDGTPEYSLHICGLRKLFPKALFIHIVRDVSSVVRSMLNFHRVAGSSLVANEQEAYKYWLRTVSSCLLAERAYGPRVVLRVRYSEFVDRPESTMRSLLNFLSEPFAAECLTPLQKRINSSNVPVDFKIGDPETDPSLVEQAMRLSTEVEKTPQPPEASPAASDEMEAGFNERISEYCNAQQVIAALQKRAERLAKEIKGKKAIIQHLRARRQRYKLRRWCFGQDSDKHRNGWWGALRESFRRRTRKS